MDGAKRELLTTLYEDDPAGIKKVKFSLENLFCISIPRSNINAFSTIEISGSENYGIYLLFGYDKESGLDKVYVGQTTDIRARLKDHERKKEWREHILMFSISTNEFTKTDLDYLENELIKIIKSWDGIIYDNKDDGNTASISLARQKILDKEIGYILEILKFLGRYYGTRKISSDKEYYYSTNTGVDATGSYDGGKFIIHAGSTGKLSSNSTLPLIEKLRKERDILENEGIIKINKDKIEFIKDHEFNSSTHALEILSLSSISGPNNWINKKNKKLLKDNM